MNYVEREGGTEEGGQDDEVVLDMDVRMRPCDRNKANYIKSEVIMQSLECKRLKYPVLSVSTLY